MQTIFYCLNSCTQTQQQQQKEHTTEQNKSCVTTMLRSKWWWKWKKKYERDQKMIFKYNVMRTMVYAFCLLLSSPLSISLWMFRFLVNNFFKYSESALRSHGDASLQFQFMSFCAMFSYCCSPFDSLSVQCVCVFMCVFCSGWWEERSLSVKIADWMLFVHHMSCDMKVPTLDLHARIEPAKVFNQLRRLRLHSTFVPMTI